MLLRETRTISIIYFEHIFPGLDHLHCYADPEQPLTTAGEELDDLSVDDLSVYDISVDDLSVDDLGHDLSYGRCEKVYCAFSLTNPFFSGVLSVSPARIRYQVAVSLSIPCREDAIPSWH